MSSNPFRRLNRQTFYGRVQVDDFVIIFKIAIVQGIEPWIMLPQNKAFQLSLSYTNHSFSHFVRGPPKWNMTFVNFVVAVATLGQNGI